MSPTVNGVVNVEVVATERLYNDAMVTKLLVKYTTIVPTSTTADGIAIVEVTETEPSCSEVMFVKSRVRRRSQCQPHWPL